MKQYRYHIAVLTMLVTAVIGCKKVDIDSPDGFSITTDKAIYKAGDTALFNLSGTADMIVFFSGEAGKNYDNRNRAVLAGIPKLVFQTNMQQGVLLNNDSLRLYVSTNLQGYDSANVVNANWTDITSRNTKWPTVLSSTFVISDSIALTDFNTSDSINIAFRATGKKYATAAQRKWQLQNLNLTNFLADGSTTSLFSTFSNTGWIQANIKNNPVPSLTTTNYQAWNVGQAGINASNAPLVISSKACNSNGIPIQAVYPITFDPSAVTNVDDNDDWLITSAINLKTVKPDVGIAIKKPVDVTLKTYKYRFATPGTYTLTFIAQNQRLDEKKEIVRQVQITVTP
ncbi:MAG: DUF5017 domain-containing protein [Chitinophagaceae bacterium]|nr:DUF5017 domain-containing protein [Chitinophagaceae bacterium]